MCSKLFRLAAVLIATYSAACTVSRTEVPPLTGPSELATSLTVTASPDTLVQDGASQSSIIVTVIGPNGRPLANVSVRLATAIHGVAQDFGTLSARTVVTGSDGRAATVYTAPAAPPPLLGGSGTTVSVQATAIGLDATTSPSRGIPSVDIRLVPPGVILPPADTPTAQFTFTPATPQANSPVAFDASASCGGRADTNGCLPSNSTIVSYSWAFGDGTTGSGRTATHTYASPGPYNATLTVTNDRGIAASTTRQVTVGAGTPPTAAFVFGPTPANVGQEVFFDASQSLAAAGHRIVQYKWNFGDGTLKDGTTPLTQHDWASSGVFVVRLTVVDEAGQEGTATQTITIGSGAPAPSFTVVVTNPSSHTVQADGSASSAAGGATVTGYTFSWGDGTSTAGGAIQSHSYGAAGTYPVTLTVTDSLGRSGASAATSVIVP